jgi:5-bromo-4-chloroindolyl phosphate hydrolysis protein
MFPMFNDDRNWLAAGIVGALLIPVLVFGFQLPYVLALGAGAVAFIGLVLLLAPRKLFEGIDVSKVGRGKLDLTRQVLVEAMPSVSRLKDSVADIRSPKIKAIVERLSGTAESIVSGVEKEPERLSSVQRFLTYYLPSAAQLAESYSVLEKQRNPDPTRLKEAETVITKLDNAFSHYADSLMESDLSGLDVDLRLIEQAIKEDIGQPT